MIAIIILLMLAVGVLLFVALFAWHNSSTSREEASRLKGDKAALEKEAETLKAKYSNTIAEKSQALHDKAAQEEKTADAEKRVAEKAAEIESLKTKYAPLIDADSYVIRVKTEADAVRADAQKVLADAHIEGNDIVGEAKSTANKILEEARSDANTRRAAARAQEEKATAELQDARKQAQSIIDNARARAAEVAGSALDAKEHAEEYAETAAAMKRIIEGYGDEWLKPTYSLLDELADEFDFTEAGKKLKAARDASANMVKRGIAAECDYVEAVRRETAVRFVVDAFNGKVDSILSKVKHDNYGVLEQKVKDAYQLVNSNGAAFRNARIQPDYLNARLEELKWAVATQELKKRAQEEQRDLRAKMREEEKARRDYERAQKEAAKEEAILQKAMEKAQAMLASASEAQRAQYEAQIADLGEKLKAAEEKNARALSMAQQTKHGTVYVISNIGSFGENVYKVGMTRRLDPQDRVRELGDASVPFPFDVHAFIESDDAPALETELHKALAMAQVNKVNPRKEFFRVDIATIKALVAKRGLEASWTIVADAAEYRESLATEARIKNDPQEKERWERFMAELATVEDDDEESA